MKPQYAHPLTRVRPDKPAACFNYSQSLSNRTTSQGHYNPEATNIYIYIYIYICIYMQAIYVYAGKLSANEASPQDAAAGCVEAMVLACIGCRNQPLTVSTSFTSGLSSTHCPSGLLVLSVWWQGNSFTSSGHWDEAYSIIDCC